MMKKGLILVSILSIFFLAGCSSASDDEIIADLGFTGLDAKEILLLVSTGDNDYNDVNISVTDSELRIITEDNTITYNMPENEFYLSVAPYINMTHGCLFHSATGCTGEILEEMFHISLIDNDGNVIIDSNYESLQNGFIDLWLPRDIEGTLTITYGDLSTTKEISTFSGEPTCETTMQLS